MVKKDIIAPRSVKQHMFVNSDADVTVFGGSAGSSKSYSGIMSFLPYIKYPTFRGVITRRTFAMLKGTGGILDTALQMFKKVEPRVKWKSQDSKFVFPSGAEISLKHFEHINDEGTWQGLQMNYCLVDEATGFDEQQIMYMMSRLRNPSCPEVKPRIAMTCNPDADSWLRKWLDDWIDEDGFPKESLCGVKRYFITKNNKLLFADTQEELHKLYDTPNNVVRPKSFAFINATIKDNPTLCEISPEYVSWLDQLPRVERARLYLGNWDVRQESSGYWKREWCEVVHNPPLNVVKKVRAWDLAGTLPSDTNPDPDYTVGALLSKDRFGTYYVEDVVRFRARHGEVFERILKTAREDGDDVLISIPREIGVAGKAYTQTIIRDLAEYGFYAKAKPAQSAKVTRFAPFCAASEQGCVKIVAGDWNEDFFEELQSFDGNKKKRRHDDQVDAVGDSFMMLASSVQIPVFSMPDLKASTPYDFAR